MASPSSNHTAEKAQYLHHDQAGSTQFIAGETGTTEAAYSYAPYSAVEEHPGTATTPFGYDAQYTSSDTDSYIYGRESTIPPRRSSLPSIQKRRLHGHLITKPETIP